VLHVHVVFCTVLWCLFIHVWFSLISFIHGLIDVWYARPDSWDLAQLCVSDVDLRAHRRICGTCIIL
jgi:hypothetical protein